MDKQTLRSILQTNRNFEDIADAIIVAIILFLICL